MPVNPAQLDSGLLSAAVNASDAGIVITDAFGRIQWVNPAFTALTGYGLEEVKNCKPNVLKSGLHDDSFYAQLWSVITAGRSWRGELVNRRKDGSLYTEEMTITPITDATGQRTNYIAVKQDVTARCESEERRRRSEDVLKQTHELAGLGQVRVAFDTGDVEWSEDTYRIFGIDPVAPPWSFDEFLRRVHPDDLPLVQRGLEQTNTDHFQSELRLVLDDGRTRLIHFRVKLHRNSQGQVVGLAAAVLDMTELAVPRERLRMLFEHSLDAHLLFSRSGIVDCNPGALKMFGADRKEQMLGLKMADLSPEFQPSRRLSKELAREMVLIARERGVHRFDWVYKRFDGADLHVEITATPDQGFSGPAMLLVVHNITERKNAEAALQRLSEDQRLALDAAGLGSWDYRFDLGLFRWDERSYAIFGIQPGVSLEYNETLSRVHPSDRAQVEDALRRALEGKNGGAYDCDFRVVWPDGSVHWVAGHGRVFFAGEGDLRRAVRFVGVNRDVTTQKELERQLSQTQKLESLGQLAAGIAHEINTPIQYIGDNAMFLKESFDDLSRAVQPHPDVEVEYLRAEIPKAISELQEGASHVARIVCAMREFSHPGSGEKQLADLNSAIESTVIVSKNVWKYVAELSTDLDAALPQVPCLLGDLNQVMLNLIVNASHAIADVVKDSGRLGAIRISTRHDGAWVEIRVSDTGSGIPEAIRSKLFDPFFTTKPVGKGTGQGLAIAHSLIVQKHGGTIAFDSDVGRGTTFIVRLPLAPES
jgi:PAS domain S-box-containing protein